MRAALRWILPVAATLVAAGCASVPVASSPAAPDALQIDNAGERPLRLDIAALEARATVSQAVHFETGHGPQAHSYTGASLWPLLEEAGVRKTGGMAAALDRYVIATGADGYRSLFSVGELNPDFGNKQSIVAYAETIDGVSNPLSATRGVLRLTAPGDVKGGRYVSDLRRIEIRPSASAVVAAGGEPAPAFVVSGAVEKPVRFDLAALSAFPQTRQTVNGRLYAGVELRTILDRAGIQRPGAGMNAGLMSYVVATGSDGYKVVLSAGEIDPMFGNQPVMVALRVDGKELGRNGMARLIVPGDLRMGRSVSKLVALEVMRAPAPESAHEVGVAHNDVVPQRLKRKPTEGG